MNQTLSDLAVRCKTLLGETPGPEGRAKVAAMLSDILADPAKVDALVPPSTGSSRLIIRSAAWAGLRTSAVSNRARQPVLTLPG